MQAKRDENSVPTLLGVSSVDGVTPVTLYADPTTHRLLTDAAGGMTNPMTTGGDIIYGGVAGVPTRLGNGTAGQVLTSSGTTLAPTWTTIAGSGDMVLADVQTVTGAKTFNNAKLYLRNVADTFSGVFSNTITAARTWTLKDADGTIAFTSDIIPAPTTIVGITGTMAQFDTAVTDGNIVYQSQALGTPASGTVTNLTGTASININGTVGATTPTTVKATTVLTGSNANFTDFPNAQAVFSQADTGEADSKNIGIAAEAQAHPSTTTQWGVGVYGVATTNAATSATGVTGEGKVTASADTAPAIGVRGYATTTHAGGRNIALYANASGSSTANLALEMAAGDIQSDAAQTWTLVDNTASALSIGATGKADILKVVTTDTAEGVTMSGTLGVTGTLTASGTIELGNATDTTLSRSAAGVLAVEGVVIPSISSTNTITNKRNQTRTASSTTSANLSPDLSTANIYFRTTQTATLTIDAPTGTPVIGEVITIYVDSAAAQTLTINTTYKAFGAAFPATTTAGKTFMMTCMYSGSEWLTTWSNRI